MREHPPLPTAAALGYSHFHHVRQDTERRELFKAVPISLRTMAKGSLTASHRPHRRFSANGMQKIWRKVAVES
jgi:hypothetical protein